MLGLRFSARASSSCSKRGPLFIVVHGPLTIMASLVAEHRLQTHRLSSCGSRAQLLRGMWDLPRPGLEPVSPASAGRFSTTAPPGKPLVFIFKGTKIKHLYSLKMDSWLVPEMSVRRCNCHCHQAQLMFAECWVCVWGCHTTHCERREEVFRVYNSEATSLCLTSGQIPLRGRYLFYKDVNVSWKLGSNPICIGWHESNLWKLLRRNQRAR